MHSHHIEDARLSHTPTTPNHYHHRQRLLTRLPQAEDAAPRSHRWEGRHRSVWHHDFANIVVTGHNTAELMNTIEMTEAVLVFLRGGSLPTI